MTEFKGHTGEMRDTTWLAAEDIKHLGDVKVEIESVQQDTDVEFEAGRKVNKVYSLKFKGKGRKLVINATNRKILKKLYGTDVTGWAGKEITLYVQDNVKMMGKVVDGIRIRAT